MNTKELRKLLKDNGVCAYTYWGKDKLISLARRAKTRRTRARTRTRKYKLAKTKTN